MQKYLFPHVHPKVVSVIQAELTATWSLVLLDPGQEMLPPLIQAWKHASRLLNLHNI